MFSGKKFTGPDKYFEQFCLVNVLEKYSFLAFWVKETWYLAGFVKEFFRCPEKHFVRFFSKFERVVNLRDFDRKISRQCCQKYILRVQLDILSEKNWAIAKNQIFPPILNEKFLTCMVECSFWLCRGTLSMKIFLKDFGYFI